MLESVEPNLVVDSARKLGLASDFNQQSGWKISYSSRKETWTLIQSGVMWLLLIGDEPQFYLTELETIQFMNIYY